jgi:hypothetical protein
VILSQAPDVVRPVTALDAAATFLVPKWIMKSGRIRYGQLSAQDENLVNDNFFSS